MKNAPRLKTDRLSFPSREEEIVQFWRDNKTFEASVANRTGGKQFIFYDGPPFATGLPHYGHLLAGTIKDVIPRYKTMKGFHVPRRFGWDCHGLPIENEIEKSKNLSGKQDIEAFGIANFNEACRSIVLRYTSEWKTTVERMGRWVDFNNIYRTMDPSFMESVWWVFKQLWDKGLVYEGFKVMPYSAKLGTPLSNFEAGENYHEVDDPALTVAFPLEEDPKVSILAWTTTPWTLPSNLALLVGPDIDYVEIKTESGKHYILAKSRLEEHFKEIDYETVKEMKGSELVGKRYQPLFNYFANMKSEGAFRVIAEETVSLDDGTGVVHAAPAFGEVDFYACKREGIPLVCPVDENGKFTKEIAPYEGIFVKEADKGIAKEIKELGRLFHQGTIHHRYPFCWRSDTPLIYKAVASWFVAVEKVKDKIIHANTKTTWVPSHLKEGRFGKWLEGARDWAISRNRYWGTPIPIWRSESGKIKVIGSKEELEELSGQKIEDLHRHFIDSLTFTIEGETYQRTPEVFDCWFESGSMPYAQNHYPFENADDLPFPADFVAEGLDQTRCWFYVLMILSTILFDEPAFKNVVVNGIVLAADGKKMSKRLRNYPDPNEVINEYGADAIRLYMLHSPAVRADDLCFTKAGVELVLRQILIPFWNAYAFFATYAKIYKWSPDNTLNKQPDALIDQWILSSLNQLIHDVEQGMDHYELQKGVEPLVSFVDGLTNWYIRRSRRRFWSDEASQDRHEAFSTLYKVLIGLAQVAAPFIPFLSEAVWQELKVDGMADSVHLSDFPTYDEKVRNLPLEEAMAGVQQAVSLGHALRKEHKLKVRQPLQKAFVTSSNQHLLKLLQSKANLIADELNVKEVDFSLKEDELVHLKVKPQFRVLGKRVGNKMPLLKSTIEKLSKEDVEALRNGHPVTLDLEGEHFVLSPAEVEVVREVKDGVIAQNEGEITVALDPTLNDELILEGLARELVNKVNTYRRDQDFDVVDRIELVIEPTDKLKEAVEKHRGYISDETLATSISFGTGAGETIDLNGEPTRLKINRIPK